MSVLSNKIKSQIDDNFEVKKIYQNSFKQALNVKLDEISNNKFSNKIYNAKNLTDCIRLNIIDEMVNTQSDIKIKKTYHTHENFKSKDYTDVIPFTLNMMSSYFKLKANTNDIVTLKEEATKLLQSFNFPLNESESSFNFNKHDLFYSYVVPKIYESGCEEVSLTDLNINESVRLIIGENLESLLEEYNEDSVELMEDKILSATQNVNKKLTLNDIAKYVGGIFEVVNHYMLSKQYNLNDIMNIYSKDNKSDYMDLIKEASKVIPKSVYNGSSNILNQFIISTEESFRKRCVELLSDYKGDYIKILNKIITDVIQYCSYILKINFKIENFAHPNIAQSFIELTSSVRSLLDDKELSNSSFMRDFKFIYQILESGVVRRANYASYIRKIKNLVDNIDNIKNITSKIPESDRRALYYIFGDMKNITEKLKAYVLRIEKYFLKFLNETNNYDPNNLKDPNIERGLSTKDIPLYVITKIDDKIKVQTKGLGSTKYYDDTPSNTNNNDDNKTNVSKPTSSTRPLYPNDDPNKTKVSRPQENKE